MIVRAVDVCRCSHIAADHGSSDGSCVRPGCGCLNFRHRESEPSEREFGFTTKGHVPSTDAQTLESAQEQIHALKMELAARYSEGYDHDFHDGDGPHCACLDDLPHAAARLDEERKTALDDVHRLRELVDYALAELWGHGNPYMDGDIDGAGFQDKAADLGIIELRPIDARDSIDGETEHWFATWADPEEAS